MDNNDHTDSKRITPTHLMQQHDDNTNLFILTICKATATSPTRRSNAVIGAFQPLHNTPDGRQVGWAISALTPI